LKKISLSVHGLLTYLSPSDLNQAAEGVTNYYYQTFGYDRQADLTGLHFGPGYGLDIFYEFYPGLHLGLGFDYFQPSKITGRILRPTGQIIRSGQKLE